MSKAVSTTDLRVWANLLSLWRLCGNARCRRPRACRADARRCFRTNFLVLPPGVQVWFAGVGQAQDEGLDFDEAMERLDASEVGDAYRDWHAAVAKSVGEDDELSDEWWREDRSGK